MEDRRQQRRFTLRLPCLITDWNDVCDPRLFEALTIDVSISGALVETEQRLSVGLSVQVNMLVRRNGTAEPINTGSCISLSGRVIRKDNNGFGISFNEEYRIVSTSLLFGQCSAVSRWLQQMQAG